MHNKTKVILYMILIGILGILGIATGDVSTTIALVIAEGLGVIDLLEAW